MKEKYPLEQLVSIKQKRQEEAEKVLAEKKEILRKENEKLATLEQKRDEVKEHKEAKLKQLRENLDAGTSTVKIEQMREYLKLVQEELKQEERKVADQKKIVVQAEKDVETARQDLFKKQKDIEKLKIHHKEWGKEMNLIQERKESVESDEMGNSLYVRKRKKK